MLRLKDSSFGQDSAGAVENGTKSSSGSTRLLLLFPFIMYCISSFSSPVFYLILYTTCQQIIHVEKQDTAD